MNERTRAWIDLLERIFQKRWILELVVSLAVFAFVLALFVSTFWIQSGLQLPSYGMIHTLGVKAYWDVGLTNETAKLEWGTVYAEGSANVIIYLQSTSNVRTKLVQRTDNWTFLDSNDTEVSPPANSTPYMKLEWSYNNEPILPGQVLRVTLILEMIENPSGVQTGFRTYLLSNMITRFRFETYIDSEPV